MPQTTLPADIRGLNFYDLDPNLRTFLRRAYPAMLQRQEDRLRDFGAWVGGPVDAQAAYSDRYAPPQLVPMLVKRGMPGERRNTVLFNPAYEATQREVYQRGIIGLSFAEKNPEPHGLSFAMGYLLAHSDLATYCPVTMTGAVAYVVQKHASTAVREKYLHESARMDGLAKTGGTWATEKHSGSDVAQTATTARRNPDGTWRLNGQKWFTSNASSGLAVATARAVDENGNGLPGGKGLGLYLVPSHLGEAWETPNHYQVTALKDKLGTRGLATAEMELNGCTAIELAAPPHGLRVMMEALGYSRVHNAVGSAGVVHRALLEAQSWMENRITFGKPLIDRPMNRKKLVELSVEWMAACALAFEAARSFDEAQNNDPQAQGWMRLMTAIAKHKTADMAVHATTMAVQIVGGNGAMTDWATERLARDAMILPVWEGPEQIQALDLVRILQAPGNAGALLLGRLHAIAKTLPADVMKADRATLRKNTAILRKKLETLEKDPASAEFVADDLLHLAGDVVTHALLCAEAAWEIANDNNPAKLTAARHFAQTAFLARHARTQDPQALTAAFNTLVYKTTPQAANQNTTPAKPGPAPSP